jgi:alpha-galactosidase
MIEEYRRARPMFAGDYYPLTGCSAASDIWVAMQFDRPDTGEGLVLAFRRSRSPFVAADFPLRALDPAATYAVEDADTGDTVTRRGETLMLDGLRIAMDEPRSSRLVFYRRVDRNMA